MNRKEEEREVAHPIKMIGSLGWSGRFWEREPFACENGPASRKGGDPHQRMEKREIGLGLVTLRSETLSQKTGKALNRPQQAKFFLSGGTFNSMGKDGVRDYGDRGVTTPAGDQPRDDSKEGKEKQKIPS